MIEQLLTLLDFKREEMSQILLVSTLLAGMSMSGLIFMLSIDRRGKLHAGLFIALTIATLIFLFGTVLDAIILPGMRYAATVKHEDQIRGFVSLSRVVVYSLVAGTAILVAVLGALGFVFSRRIGAWTTGAAILVVSAFVACGFYLDDVMRR